MTRAELEHLIGAAATPLSADRRASMMGLVERDFRAIGQAGGW
jgi:hypothetical protein